MKNANDQTMSTREQGAALFVAVLLLVMMSFIGMAALDITSTDQQVAGHQKNKRISFYAADAGIAEGRQTLEVNGTPTVSTSTLGDATIYPEGLPSYRPDPTSAQPITEMGATGVPGMNLRITGNGPRYQLHYWRIQVQGQTAAGQVTHLESTSAVLDSSS